MNKFRIFLASSSELADERREFEQLIGRKNKDLVDRGVFLELVLWEDFLDNMSQTRLQDEYNGAIRTCDVFVMLFFTKVGPYTKEEFQTAFGHFKATKKPLIFTYFKDASINIGSANRQDLMSLWEFQETLKSLGHFRTDYKNTEGLKLHFTQQLEKLVTTGVIAFEPEQVAIPVGLGSVVATGPGATAVGAGGVAIGGDSHGSINTGTQIKLGRGE